MFEIFSSKYLDKFAHLQRSGGRGHHYYGRGYYGGGGGFENKDDFRQYIS